MIEYYLILLGELLNSKLYFKFLTLIYADSDIQDIHPQSM